MSAEAVPETVKVACPHDCPDTCAMLVTVENGVATKIQGDPSMPFTDGTLCTKVAHYLERTYAPGSTALPAETRRAQRPRRVPQNHVGRGARRDRRAPERARRRKPGEHPAVQLRRHHGHGAVQLHGPALLPPPGRLAPRPHAVLERRQAGLARDARRLGRHGSGALRRGEAHPPLGREPDRLQPASVVARAGSEAPRREGGGDRPVPQPLGGEVHASTSRFFPAPTGRSRSA